MVQQPKQQCSGLYACAAMLCFADRPQYRSAAHVRSRIPAFMLQAHLSMAYFKVAVMIRRRCSYCKGKEVAVEHSTTA